VRDPLDKEIQTRLKALLDLQTVLETQHVPPHMLKAARDQVTRLQSVPAPPPAPVPQAPVSIPVQAASPAPPQVPVSHLSQPSLPPLPSATSLADLLASVAKSQHSPPPPPPSNPAALLSQPQSQNTHQSLNLALTSSGPENPLIASLRAAGILPPSGSTPVNGPVAQAPTPLSYPPRLPTISTPPVQLASLFGATRPQQGARNDVELTSASLKM